MPGLPILIPILATPRTTFGYVSDGAGGCLWDSRFGFPAWPSLGGTLQSAFYAAFGAAGPSVGEYHRVATGNEWCQGWLRGRTRAWARDGGALDGWVGKFRGGIMQTFVEMLDAVEANGFPYRWIVVETLSWCNHENSAQGFCRFSEGEVVYDQPSGPDAYRDALDWIDANY